jgi:hypothetical protein
MQPANERQTRLFDELVTAWNASGRCEDGLCGCGEARACAYRRGYRDALLRAYVVSTGEHPGQVRARLQDLYLTSDLPLRPMLNVLTAHGPARIGQ